MNHLRTITKPPAAAQGVSTSVKLTFLGNVIDAAIPLFDNKDPQNPVTSTGTGDTV